MRTGNATLAAMYFALAGLILAFSQSFAIEPESASSSSRSSNGAVPKHSMPAGTSAPLPNTPDILSVQQPKPSTLDLPKSETPTLAAAILTSVRTPRIYGHFESLLWWVEGAPLSLPLVSTGPTSTTHHGFLNSTDSTILYGSKYYPAMGGSNVQDFPAFAGGRVTLGYWLDSTQRFAIEGSAFMLGRRSAGFAARGNENGYPILNIPVYNTTPYDPGGNAPLARINPGEDGLPFSLPDNGEGGITGGVKITNSLRLWGADFSGLINLFRSRDFELSGILGFRYLDMTEAFDLAVDLRGFSGNYLGQSGTVNETFRTRNQFYGQILGLRSSYNFGRFTGDLTVRAALGSSHQVLNVWGKYDTAGFPPPTASGDKGIFVQPANKGRFSSNRFALVPEAQFKLMYALTPGLRVTAGYDFLWYSSVLRPTDQIDRSIPKGQTFDQADPTISTTSPAKFFVPRDFYAHGLNLGLDFRY